jgi:hypothetical protein
MLAPHSTRPACLLLRLPTNRLNAVWFSPCLPRHHFHACLAAATAPPGPPQAQGRRDCVVGRVARVKGQEGWREGEEKRGVVACGDRAASKIARGSFAAPWLVCLFVSPPLLPLYCLSSSRFSLHSLDTITDTQRQQACLPVSFLPSPPRSAPVNEPLPSHGSIVLVLYYHSCTYPSMPSPFCWTSPDCIYAFSITRCHSSSSRPAPFVRPKPS